VNCFNTELGNSFGNLVHRILNLTVKYCGGVITEKRTKVFPFEVQKLVENVEIAMRDCHPQLALTHIMNCVRDTNKWLTDLQPWKVTFFLFIFIISFSFFIFPPSFSYFFHSFSFSIHVSLKILHRQQQLK
jgi:hypothetical protein